MKYRKYDDYDFEKIFIEYEKTKITQKELSKKYKIPISTLMNRYLKYQLKKKNINVEKKKIMNLLTN
jgi:xanthine dehydrogenase iron-sulfur cluster and FAD-binding subunit A